MFFGRQVPAVHTKWNMEAEIILLGPRKRCWNLQVKALYFFKTRGSAGRMTYCGIIEEFIFSNLTVRMPHLT
jgi:hypothetical protein